MSSSLTATCLFLLTRLFLLMRLFLLTISFLTMCNHNRLPTSSSLKRTQHEQKPKSYNENLQALQIQTSQAKKLHQQNEPAPTVIWRIRRTRRLESSMLGISLLSFMLCGFDQEKKYSKSWFWDASWLTKWPPRHGLQRQ